MHSLRLELSAATSASARLEAELKAKTAEAERSSNDVQARAFVRVCAHAWVRMHGTPAVSNGLQRLG